VTRALAERFEKLQASNEQKLVEIRGEVEKKLTETIESTTKSFDKVTERLSDLRVTNERIIEFSRDLQELQSILQAPRMRGEMGEMEMEQMLRQCLAPHQFEIQHSIDGGRVDAVIFNPEGDLPIDCKFPLEQWRIARDTSLTEEERTVAKRGFTKAVKNHMDTIAQKYIRPPQTLEFAVMYIPVEGVYYDLIENNDLAEHAHRCRVIPASPLTFWALLQVIVMGFRGMQISENARRISGLLVALRDDMKKFREAFVKAATQVENASKNMGEASRQLDRVDSKLETIHANPLESSTIALPVPGTPSDSTVS
jgi:DNA recombination protein RmuC